MYGMRIALYNIANIHLLQKNMALANVYIQKTISITSEQDAISMFHINQLYYSIKAASGNYEEAIAIAQKSVQYALAEKDLKNVEAAYANLLAGYLTVNDSAKAYQISIKLNQLKDSIYNVELAKQMAIKASTYDYERKQQQNLLLSKENDLIKAQLANEHLMLEALSKEQAINALEIAQSDSLAQWLKKENLLRQQDLQQQKILNRSLQKQQQLSEANIKNERRIRWYTYGIITLLAILVTIAYTAYRKQRAANIIIKSQAGDLAVLMKELHHRVKNNLQMIIAMLRMQGRYQNTHQNIQQILKEVEHRLQAVALVHEKLYKQANVKDLMLGVYLEELLSHLKEQSLQHKPVVTTVIDEVHFVTNLDTAIPIALVVNEIAINAIKYAQPTSANVLQLRIHIYRKEQDLVLVVSDNGQGLPQGFDVVASDQIGFRLIRLFAEQLHATVSYYNNAGASFTLQYKKMLA
jgi:two-component sensor histidine kinase